MFNFFKKKKISQDDFLFLKSVVFALPEKYSFLRDQVNTDFIIRKEISKDNGKGCYDLVLNSEYEEKYSNYNVPHFFIIKGIRIKNIKTLNFDTVELHVIQGLLVGYVFDANLRDLDLSNIDTSSISEKLFTNEDKEKLVEIFKNNNFDYRSFFQIDSTFCIEIEDGKKYYVIVDCKDGNYYVVNNLCEVFLTDYSDGSITKVSDSVLGFVNSEEYSNLKLI